MKLVKNRSILLVCFVVSFCFLLICSNNSFLYSFNDNQDVNWYITMGNGMLDGKVPYRDLFEQKGPIVYFLFSFICLFENSFRMVFLVEIMCLAIFLFYFFKIVRKHTDDITSILVTVVVAFLVSTSAYFVVGGGAVEEYFLPALAYMMMCFIEFLHENKMFSKKRTFTWGVLMGVILFSKYTLLFLPLLMLGIIIVLGIFREKKINSLVKFVFCLLLGFLVITVPIVFYFVVNGGFKDFVYTYFYINLFLYKTSNSIIYNFFNIVIMGIVPFIVMVLGNFEYLKRYKGDNIKYLYVIIFCFYFLFFLISGNFLYYYLPLVVFLPFGVMMVVNICLKYMLWLKSKVVLIPFVMVLVVACLFFGNGTRELTWEKEDYIQFQVKNDIKKINSESPTLFCYKMWDYGFYNVLGVVPNVKYYANNLILEESFPKMYESFRSYVSDAKTEFLLVEKDVYENEYDFITKNYECYSEYSYRHYKDNYRSFQMDVVLLVRIEK